MSKHTAVKILSMIRRESRDELDKGESFEKLFKILLQQMPVFEVSEVHRWKEWPDREKLTRLPYSDSGIDMVARLKDGSLVAIQCKCYNENHTIQRSDIDKFLAVSGPPFDMRWFVATCAWGKNAEDIIQSVNPPVRRIDFHTYDDVVVSDGTVRRKERDIYEVQQRAIDKTVAGLARDDRGQLIMACGTGKTYVALQIAKRIVPAGGRILFLIPSIALASQARREWLEHGRDLRGLMVCSEKKTSGRGENEDMRVSELECPVTTDPERIATILNGMKGTGVVFCTYQSLKKVSEAQHKHGAPDFDLIVADEAHRTTGVERSTGFHMVHDAKSLKGKKRLYMTATPRIYTPQSKKSLVSRGYKVHDMEDWEMFGEELHRLSFKEAVEAKRLSNYKITILAMHESESAHDLYDKIRLATGDDREMVIAYEDVERLLGVALAVNGIGREGENTERLPSVLGFANSIERSKIFTKLLELPELQDMLRSRLGDPSARLHRVSHVDGKSSPLYRDGRLRDLGKANNENPHMVCNVKLFTEGVDVPALNAVAFLDPRDSMVDIVQAVGRVMRRTDDKTEGRIIVPILLNSDNIIQDLESNRDGWKPLGNVIRALQSHDGRLPENPARFMELVGGPNGDGQAHNIEGIQDTLEFQEISEQIYTKVVAVSGLKPGQETADNIESAVKDAGRVFKKAGLADVLADVLGLKGEGYKEGHICEIAALLAINACLLYRRLQDGMDHIIRLDDMLVGNTRHVMRDAFKLILERDYKPVFEPALGVLDVLPGTVDRALRRLVTRADQVADSLNELGYDHAGPLYHKILGTAQSDSANYTVTESAIMLARLAFQDGFTDWGDVDGVCGLRVMDPACGTGTLLMAALKTIKDRIGYDNMNNGDRSAVHRRLVEDVLCGLDINRHAVQMAACNLTLGAPTIDYKNMNLYTLKHGPQPSGGVKAGSVEILRAANDRDVWKAFVQPLRELSDMQARQVDDAETIPYPIRGLGMVIMNPPFGGNKHRSSKFPPDVVDMMRKNELAIRAELRRMDGVAGDVITEESISTFFTPLADRLLDPNRGTLARVLAVTECTSALVLGVRKFLADRFWVERVITTHDPKRLNFSYKTGMHECLMICRRYDGDAKPPTQFVSLYRMPKDIKEAIEAADVIASGDPGEWGSVVSWPADRVMAGDWSPVQWCDDSLAETIRNLESSPLLERVGQRYKIGPAGQQLRGGNYKTCKEGAAGAVRTFWFTGAELRKTIHGEPESWRMPANAAARKQWSKRSNLLVAAKFDTVSGRLTALYSDEPSIGSGFIPVNVKDKHTAKALAMWWNSTPVRMMLLNRRSKKLTYPHWSMEHLREIGIPKPDNPGWDALREAYEQVCDMDLQPLKNAVEDPARAIMDDAAAKVLGIDPQVIAGWREKLAKEPTITNKQLAVEQ